MDFSRTFGIVKTSISPLTIGKNRTYHIEFYHDHSSTLDVYRFHPVTDAPLPHRLYPAVDIMQSVVPVCACLYCILHFVNLENLWTGRDDTYRI